LIQLLDDDILRRLVTGEVSHTKGISALHDRDTGRFRPGEGRLHDYKETIQVEQVASMAELARDILGFSNTDGGLLIIGVADDKTVIGHAAVDFRRVRDAVGVFIGTRVDFDLEEVLVTIRGKTHRLIVVIVLRSQTAYPNLLRKDIEIEPGAVRKMKYIKGTLFYRRGSETLGS
jgi:predicted HTH transcriptional regulator